MKLLQMADRVRYSRMTTSEKRETFLPEGMFNAMPTGLPLKLETQPELRAASAFAHAFAGSDLRSDEIRQEAWGSRQLRLQLPPCAGNWEDKTTPSP